MQKLLKELEGILARDHRFVRNGRVLKSRIIEAACGGDESLIRLLFSNQHLKNYFFREVDNTLIFNQENFQKFLNNDFINHASAGEFDRRSKKPETSKFLPGISVSLVWLGKDADTANQFTGSKIFTNFKKVDKKGVAEVKRLSAKDNFIFRGDNLPVLHSLKKIFSDKIRLIYIDPPYNTGNASFHYQDNRGQAEWLSFIHDRMKIARDLLSPAGFLFFHISFHQYAYTKVLLDEIFNGNHVCTFNLLVRHPDRILKADKDFHDVVEYLLVYTKNKVSNKIAKRIEAVNMEDYVYKVRLTGKARTTFINNTEVEYYEPGRYEILKCPPSEKNLRKISIRGSLKEGNSSGRFYEKHLVPVKAKFPPFTLFKIPGIGKDNIGHRYFYTPEKGNMNGGYFQGMPAGGRQFKEKPYPNFFDLVKEFNQVGYEGQVDFRNGKKPEALLKKVFEIAKLNPGDIVLDFFLGSGTTAATAHKMGIQYIGIEQTDYGENDSVQRLISVIKGETGGISGAVGWKGGGKFIYAELNQVNRKVSKKEQQLNQQLYHLK